MRRRMVDGLKERFSAPPRTYADGELRALGIDPNLMLFMSRPDFSDNAYALWEHVAKNTRYRTAWLLLAEKHSAKLTGKGIENAPWNSPEGRALAGAARYFIQTTNDARIAKGPGQIFVNVWHGTGVKATDFLSFSGDNPHLLRLTRAVDCTDLFLVHSFADKMNMAAEFCCDARRFAATGQPRLDRVKIADGKNNIKKLFDGVLPEYEKLILYAPTARITSFSKVGESFTSNAFNLADYRKEELDAFLERRNAVLVVKLHPIEKNKYTHADLQLGARGRLLTDDDLFYADLQMNDVLNAFDVMIGDYSSMITDFLLLDRPIVYALDDFDEYAEKEGFSHNDVSFYMPGDKIRDFFGLLKALDDAFALPERHGEWRRTVLRQKSTFMDGNACERALRAIENWRPLTNYGEALFAEKTLFPIAEEYENALDEIDERLWNSENRVSAAARLLEEAPEGDPAVGAALAALRTPPVSRAEEAQKMEKSRLEGILADILAPYPGEDVFFLARQKRDWTGATRTMAQQLAAHIAGMGRLVLLGAFREESVAEPVVAYPDATRIHERLFALYYGEHTETVLDCIRRHGKKAIFIVPSDFYGDNDRLLELGTTKAHRAAYIYRYHIKNYLGKKKHTPCDVARWEALQYARRNEGVCFVACGDALRGFSGEGGANETHLLEPGVDFSMFSGPRHRPPPEALRRIRASGKPVIGYCGTIDNRLYYSLIHYMCGKRKDCEFVFIGANRIADTWGHTFDGYPNVHLLPEVAYDDVPGVLHAFDAAIIPYFTAFGGRTPAKLFEYFACGKPVATTNMAIAKKYTHIFMGESHGDFINALDAALDGKDDAGLRAHSMAIARENDWGRKTEEFLGWVEL